VKKVKPPLGAQRAVVVLLMEWLMEWSVCVVGPSEEYQCCDKKEEGGGWRHVFKF